ncbi:MAG: LamG domain-containing protein, partial [Pseudothermotoga sp.]
MRKLAMFLIMVCVVTFALSFEPLKDRSLIAYFPFDEDFKDASGKFGEAEITGSTIGGTVLGKTTIEFKEGMKGTAAYFPGRRGLILPEDLIKDYDYTFAFWVNPEKFTMHTTTFFGIFVDENQGYHWVSFV